MAKFRIELEHTDWQQILDLVSQAPYRNVAPLIGKISEQLQAGPLPQTDGAQPPAEPPTLS